MPKIYLHFTCYWLIFLGWTWPAYGQKTLTIEEALSLAHRHSPQLQSKREGLQQVIGMRHKAQQWLAYNPEIQFQWGNQFVTGRPEDYNLQLQVSQTLELADQRGLRIKQADLAAETAQLEIDEAWRQLRGMVQVRFYQLFFLQEKRKVTQSILALSQQVVDMAQQRFKAQDIAQIDLEYLQLDQEQLQLEDVQLQGDLITKRTELEQTMGHPLGKTYQVASTMTISRVNQPLQELQDLALKQRPDYRLLEMTVAQARYDLELIQRNQIPNLTLSLGFSQQAGSIGPEDFIGNPQGLQKIIENDSSALIGASIPIPLLSNLPNLQIAQSLLKQAELAQKNKRLQILTEVQQHYVLLQQGIGALETMTKLIPGYKHNLEALIRAYQLGEVSLEKVVLNKQRLYHSWLRQLSLYELHYQTGIALETSLGTFGMEKTL